MFKTTNANETKMSYLDTVSSETLTRSSVLSRKVKSYVESDGSISFFMETA